MTRPEYVDLNKPSSQKHEQRNTDVRNTAHARTRQRKETANKHVEGNTIRLDYIGSDAQQRDHADRVAN